MPEPEAVPPDGTAELNRTAELPRTAELNRTAGGLAGRLGVEGFAHPVVMAVLAVGAVGALAARFVVTSPMWLDEALSINIARLPLGRIPEALRHDGHPPLYYVLLHAWSAVFGTTNAAVRGLSGVISLATLPLAWFAGRRLGTPRTAATLTLALALSPFALRFGSETRMYSLVIAEVFVLALSVRAAFDRPTRRPLVGVALATSALLWTHYWSMWLLVAVGAWVAVRAVRTRTKRSFEVLGSLALGGVSFIPWLPTLLYQAEHTGTPWSPPFRPAGLVYASFGEFAGGPYSESQLLLLLLTVCVFVGVTGRSVDARRIDLDLHGRTDAYGPLFALFGTIVVASVAGAATGMAFAPRYASVFFPFFVMLVALGLDRLSPGRARDIALFGFALLSFVGLYQAYSLERSQAQVVADQIADTAPGGLVVACPDQLGPPIERALSGGSYEVVRFPDLGDARFVDWVDYAERNRRTDPADVGRRVLELAGDRAIFVAYRDDFRTLTGQCSAMLSVLSSARPGTELAVADGDTYFEPISAVAFAER